MKFYRRNIHSPLNIGITTFGFILLYVPIVVVATYSLISLSGNSFQLDLTPWTTLFENERLANALISSLSVATASATVAAILGTLGAVGLERGSPVLKRTTEMVAIAPFVLPELIFGLALLLWFVFLRFTLGWVSLVLAHVTFSVSYVVMTVRGRMKLLDPLLTDAAQDLGATQAQVFLRVTLPLLFPAIAASWLMAFALSFDDFLISFFTAGVETVTLPIALYGYIKFGVDRQIFALSTLLFALTLVGVIAATRVQQSSPTR